MSGSEKNYYKIEELINDLSFGNPQRRSKLLNGYIDYMMLYLNCSKSKGKRLLYAKRNMNMYYHEGLLALSYLQEVYDEAILGEKNEHRLEFIKSRKPTIVFDLYYEENIPQIPKSKVHHLQQRAAAS